MNVVVASQWQQLQEIVGEEVFLQLVHELDMCITQQVQALEQAQSAHDLIAVREAAHALKSATANLGMAQLSDLARQLEHAAHHGDTAGVEALMPGPMRQAAQAAQEVLKAALDPAHRVGERLVVSPPTAGGAGCGHNGV